ncbi:helicase-related protein [Brachyspira innocens]|uniref:Helicase-related protein n=3 Tax=Brachyspira innocens TaxID=13264 RepID=A0ABT8YX53_9SPIR|nr:helicase-related protein [Brachyspira innocens]MDO7020070.1 helicase-related protein [Brachyspira innocens]
MKILDNVNTKVFEIFKTEENIKEIGILSAYCSYSAFYDIANDKKARETFLKANVKIIMGMNIDPKIQCLYINYNQNNTKTNIEEFNDFVEYTISELNKNSNNKTVLELFKEKCQNSSLEIRSANDKTHAKLYVLRYNDKNSIKKMHGCAIIGSSNFSREGLHQRKEINAYTEDGFEEFYNFFQDEWKNTSSILDKENEKEFFDKVGIKDKEETKQNNNDAKETNKYPTPYEIYLKVIYEYFNFFSNEKLLFTPKDFNYSNYKYQIDAIKSGIKSIMTYGGVLISDVVGLGKSIIASAIAKNLIEMKAVEEIIIVSPPKIIYSWENYNAEFKLNAVIKSVGKLDELYEYVKNHKKTRLIIIDEAHRFVNSKTESYNIIKNICSANKVMLLTATPMHNTTSDIFSLIDIFDRMLTTDKSIAEIKSSILKEERIIKSKYKKDDNEKETKEKIKDISKQILGLINPIIIRRTRKDLKEDLEYRKDLEEQKTEFNNVEDPKLHDYNLGDISKLYSDTFEKITPNDDEYNNKENDKTLFDDNNNNTEINNNKFKAVRYEPLTYLKYTTIEEKKNADKIIEYVYGENINADFASTSSRNLTKFMKHLLVRRFESSLYAFKKSIDNMIYKYENIKTWINKDLYPIYKKGDTLYIEDFFSYDESSDDENDIEYDEVLDFNKANKKIKDVKIIENVKEVLEDKFFEDFENDLQILKQIKKNWDNISSDKDKKFIKLIEELKKFKKENDKRKIIIFTEFKDTADYLYESVYKDDELRELFKPIKSTSQSKNRDIIAANFDASLNTDKQEDDYFLLIATDTLSEGINLHRAGIIINYDIPYNPTRVIQRVGRINRIGKKLFDKIYIHNFIPRLEAQKDIKNWQISNFKLNLINAILGNDTKILKKDDEINSLFSLKRENEILTDDDISWDNEYRDVYNKLKNDDKLLERIKSIENNIVIRRESNFSGLLEIIQSKNGVFGSLLKNSKIDFNIENIFKTLKADKNEKYVPPSENIKNFEDELKRRKNIKKSASSHSGLNNFYQYLDNDEDRDYVKKLINITENKYLSDKTIKDIEKALKSKSGCSVKILQNIISLNEVNEKFNYSSNNLQSIYEDSYLIVKEEFSKYNN